MLELRNTLADCRCHDNRCKHTGSEESEENHNGRIGAVLQLFGSLRHWVWCIPDLELELGVIRRHLENALVHELWEKFATVLASEVNVGEELVLLSLAIDLEGLIRPVQVGILHNCLVSMLSDDILVASVVEFASVFFGIVRCKCIFKLRDVVPEYLRELRVAVPGVLHLLVDEDADGVW